MECSIERIPEQYPENDENRMEYYWLGSILDIDNFSDRIIDNMENINHIESKIKFYTDFLNNKTINEYLSKNTEWFSLEEIEEIKNNFNKFLKHIYHIVVTSNISIISSSSIIDILGNWPYTYMKIISNKIAKNSEYSEQIDNIVKTVKTLQILIDKYIKNLCFDEENLELALTNENWYIWRYSWYFKKMISRENKEYIMYPSGSEKLHYFHFFLSYELWNIWNKNLEEELEKLNDNIIDKDKVRIDFPILQI